MNASVISIRPRFAEAIVSGRKRIELRRLQPTMSPGHLLYIYASSPSCAVIGSAVVRDVEVRTVGGMWRAVGEGVSTTLGLTKSEYEAYFEGCERAIAIHLWHLVAFENPLTLAAIRARSPVFHPPRTWASIAALPLPLQRQLILLNRARAASALAGAVAKDRVAN